MDHFSCVNIYLYPSINAVSNLFIIQKQFLDSVLIEMDITVIASDVMIPDKASN